MDQQKVKPIAEFLKKLHLWYEKYEPYMGEALREEFPLHNDELFDLMGIPADNTEEYYGRKEPDKRFFCRDAHIELYSDYLYGKIRFEYFYQKAMENIS